MKTVHKIRAAAFALGALTVGFSYAASSAGESRLTQVAAFEHQVTGVTVSPGGRVFVNFPRWTDDAPISVAELLPGGRLRPYPDATWNAWRNASQLPPGEHFVCVQSVVADTRGGLWVLDPAAPGNEKILPGGPKLVRIALSTDKVTQVIRFGEDVALQGSYLNDIRISPDGKTGYITDSGARGAIVVVDLVAGTAFRALDGHPATQAEKDVAVVVDGKKLLRPDGRQPTFAADGIALSKDGATLYWQALTGRTLYSIPTALLSKRTPPAELAAAVQKVATTLVADGLWASGTGAIYVTAPGEDAVKVWTGSKLETVVSDKRLRWPDTLAQGPDGTLYVTASHIQDSSWFKPGAPASVASALFALQPGR